MVQLVEASALELTKDGGQTWSFISFGGWDATFLGSKNNILQVIDGVLSTSHNNGNTWSYSGIGGGCRSFAITPKGTVFAGHDPIQMSTDFGNSWQSRPGRYVLDSYSMDIGRLCDDSTLYIVNELVRKIPETGEIYVSTDAGNSFTTKFPNSTFGYFTGAMVTSRHAVFCGTSSNGILRSTDRGKTWVSIGGPGLPFDSRSIAVINDNTLFAIDSLGTLWETTNCGGAPITSPSSPKPILSSLSGKASSCDSGKALASLMHTYCDALTITEATLQGADAPYFTLQPQSLPISLGNGAKINFSLGFNPKKQVRSFSAQIHVKGFYIFEYEDTVRIDTLIPVSAISTAVGPILVASPASFIFPTVSTCKPPIDTTVTFTNKGCDTLTITQGPGALSPQFKLLPPFTLPIKIPPDSSLSIIFQFTPSGTGTFTADPLFTAVQQGLSQNISLHLEGTGKQEGGVFAYSPKQFSFKSLSICDHDSASGFMTNTGCDSLLVDPTHIFSDADFTLAANSVLLSLKPGDTIHYQVYLNPTQKGLRQGYLVLTTNDKFTVRHDTVHFTVTVTEGTVFLSSLLAQADFGAVSVCEERDTMITLQNTGCDTMIVYGVSGLGSGFGTDTKFPIMILRGKDTVIHIFTVLDTAGGKLLTTGTLTIQSNANDTLLPIILSRSFIQSTHRDVGLFLDAQAKAGGDLSIVTYDIKESPNKTFTGAGIQNVNFSLNYNTDLLTFDQTKSTNVSSSDGKSFTIAGNPIVADGNGVLATVGFRVYLTKDSVTTIDMTNRTDTTNLPCGRMTLSTGGSATFDYNYLCGERSIAGFYNGVMPLKIVSLHPNPSQDEIELDVRSEGKQDAVVEIFDALGVKVFSEIRNMEAGANIVHLDTKGLSSGMYLLRVGGASKTLVVRR
ncbi:MAG: choice-of-anchor D domain-containing protein [Candidatus Kapaibacterium sp.]